MGSSAQGHGTAGPRLRGSGGAEILSPHPADRLIRELIRTPRSAAPEEIAQIVGRVASAPFEPRRVRVRAEHRRLTYLGRTLGAQEDSLFYHLVKRVLVERQWADGTTAEQYLRDMRQAVLGAAARLVLFERRGGALAATLTPTDLVVPDTRRGVEALPELLVVYSADRGIIVTGYQVSGLGVVGIPEGALWLA